MPNPTQNNGRLLIVEDQALVARDLEKRLGRLGYEVIGRCGKPDAAIALALEHRPDLMLLDINLNAKLDGIDVATEVGKHFDVPVVYCTAYSDDEVLDRAKVTTPYGYVLKPFEDRELEIAIEVALYKHRTEQEQRAVAGRISATLNSIGDAVVACDANGLVFTINAPAELLTGIESASAVGAPLQEVLNLRNAQTFGDVLNLSEMLIDQRRALRDFRLMLVRNDGVEIPVELTATPIEASGALDGVVLALRDITRQLKYEAHIESGAFTEPVTGLLNRNLFLEQVNAALRRYKNDQRPSAMILIDIDRFRAVNDGIGSDLGDAVLKKIAERVSGNLANFECMTRLNADVFGCLVENINALAPLEKIARKIQAVVAEPILLDGQEIILSASIGACITNEDHGDARELLRDADTAKHQAKRRGPSSFAVFEAPMRDSSAHLWQLSNRLTTAVDSKALQVHYQPIVGPDSYAPVGLEALMRWNAEDSSAVGPGEFVPLAERIGLIQTLGTFVLEEVCQQIARWRGAGLSPPRVHINLSPLQFGQDSLVKTISETLDRFNLDTQCLGLEVTETTAMGDLESTAKILRQCADAGLSVSIDDFGTGHSSLAYLKRLPLDTLKIDRSFIIELATSSQDKALVRGIIAMAHELGLGVLAEGVESQDQESLLKDFGCDLMQGYLFGHPASADAISVLLNPLNLRSAPKKSFG